MRKRLRELGLNPRALGTNPRAMRNQKKAITTGKSDKPCKICKGEMIIRKHSQITDKLRKQHYYFSQWEYCLQCKKVFFNDAFKVNNPKGEMWEEIERQERHLLNI